MGEKIVFTTQFWEIIYLTDLVYRIRALAPWDGKDLDRKGDKKIDDVDHAEDRYVWFGL